MKYLSVQYVDDTGYATECDDILIKETYIELWEGGMIRDIIPFANLKAASVINKKQYKALTEDDDG